MAAALPALLASVAGAVVTNLLKEEAPTPQPITQAAAPPPPAVEPVPEMPTPDDAQARAAKRRSIASQMARRGRASTILTDTDDKLGG